MNDLSVMLGAYPIGHTLCGQFGFGKILSSMWRESQKIRYAVRSELPWSHFCHSRAGGNPVELKISRVAGQHWNSACFAECFFLLDSRLRGNDETL